MICRRARLGAPETPAAADALRCTANYLLQPSQTQLRCSKQPASERKRPVLRHTCSSRSRKPQSCHEPTRQVERAIIAHQSEAPDCHHPSRHLEGVVFQSGWKILPYATPCSRRKRCKGSRVVWTCCVQRTPLSRVSAKVSHAQSGTELRHRKTATFST